MIVFNCQKDKYPRVWGACSWSIIFSNVCRLST